MTENKPAHTHYDQWLAERRDVRPPSGLAEQVMSRVVELDCERRSIWWVRLVQRIECSRAARWSVCGGALAIGCLPFFFFARVASF